MDNPEPQRVTRLLESISAGDPAAADDLLPIVYAELRGLARARMAQERPGLTLQPTALVHEAYLRLIGGDDVRWNSRGHFFAAAAQAMRRILIEQARRKARKRHGGELRRTTLDGASPGADVDPAELIALDAALTRLEAIDAGMADVVKLRYFAGLTVEETAHALDVSTRTVNRTWAAAKTWLYGEMSEPEDAG